MGTRTRVLGFLLTAIFLVIAFNRVDLAALIGTLRGANYSLVPLAALSTLAGYGLRTWRWQFILHPSTQAPLRRLFPILMLGFTTNNLLPARLGEFVRAFLAHRRLGVGRAFALTTILLERVFDGLTLVAALALASLLFPMPGWAGQVELFALLVFAAASGGIVSLLVSDSWARRLTTLVLRPFPAAVETWAHRRLDGVLVGLDALRSPATLLPAAVISVTVWTCEGISYYVLMRAFGVPLEGGALVTAALFLLAVVNLGIMLPSAPGYVGTFQFFAVTALAAFGVQKEMALGLALVSHGMQYALVTSIGLAYMLRDQLSLRAAAEARV